MKVSLFALCSSLVSAAVFEATDKDIETYLSKNVPMILDLYASWCGHCKTFSPVFDKLASEYEHLQDRIQFVKVDGDINREVSKRFDLQYFPTIKFVHGDRDEEIDDRDPKAIKKYIEKNVGITPDTEASPRSADAVSENTKTHADTEAREDTEARMERKISRESTESHVVSIIDDNFEETIRGKNTLLAFTTTWCAYCKKLAPEWDTLAQIFSRDEDVLIANADCTDHELTYSLMETFGVTAFPEIVYIPHDVSDRNGPTRYQGPRTLEDLVKFAKDLGISHRGVDGKLDDQAGLIPDLDLSVLPDYKALETRLSKINAKSADVYKKVLEKAAVDSQYLKREAQRLEKILESTLKPRDADNFQIKLNIVKSLLTASGPKAKDEL